MHVRWFLSPLLSELGARVWFVEVPRRKAHQDDAAKRTRSTVAVNVRTHDAQWLLAHARTSLECGRFSGSDATNSARRRSAQAAIE